MTVHTVIQVGDCVSQFDGTLSKGSTATVVKSAPLLVYRTSCGADSWTIPGTHARLNATAAPMAVQPASS